jgi:D-alanyl-D-alanine carboxypeptidase
LTAHSAYADWQTTLVDTIYMVPSSYYPRDLVSTGLPGGGSIRALTKADLTAMAKAAASAGAPLQVASAFRSYATQVSTFNYWVRVGGRAAALLSSARPGHSEHQLGLAIDFTSRGGAAPWNYADWAKTKAGAWMAANAWRYGWVMSYPKGKSPSVTCYQYEPWHYRYVGRTEAAAIHASGLTTRAYLWNQQ